MAVNVAEEVLSGVLQAAEQLQGAVVAAETGCVESLRWSGAMPLLLRDFNVQNLVSYEEFASCTTFAALQKMLIAPNGNESVGHVVLLLSGFLWDYEPQLKQLLALGVVQRLTVCSSLSERAHECYDFGKLGEETASGARATKSMKFEEFAAELSKNATFPTQNGPELSTQQGEEEWGWEDAESEAKQSVQVQNGVMVIHLPLNVVPLLSSKTFSPEPSVFVLSHPTCAAAFPLLLHQVEEVKMALPTSPTGRGAAGFNSVGGNKYSHVKDVLPEHIPSAFRRSMRLLAYTLAEMMVGARLDVKERIFALGATSLKIGHTLLRILNELQEDAGAQPLQGQQAASMVIIDRTCDLVSPCSFGSSLLDRILALLPQTPTDGAAAEDTEMKRSKLNVTDIYPLHGCEPTPLTLSTTLTASLSASDYRPSEFVSQIQWKGGASLCHPGIPSGSNVFRSLAFRPAKLALRDLDKRLQAVEQALLQQGKIQKTPVTRRPGEKPRGRDVVLRRLSKILEAGEPTNLEYSSLVELGVIVLETLERMEQSQPRWEKYRERAMRQLELRKKGGGEWIIPELADAVKRQLSASQSGVVVPDEERISLMELLTLLVQAFALSSEALLEDFTIQMIQQALAESTLQATKSSPHSVKKALPELFDQLSPYIDANGTQAEANTEGDDWDWNDGGNSPTKSKGPGPNHNGGFQMLEAKSVIDTYIEDMMATLKDCTHQFAKISDEGPSSKTEDSPRSLITELCNSIINPSGTPILLLNHVVDASEQLTRAGIDLLKSGFSKFGFGGSGGGGGQRGTNSSRLLGESNILVVFVVGGITFEEIQEVHDALSENTKFQIILGGTTITNNEIILKKLFSS